jgi:hypothetical protein
VPVTVTFRVTIQPAAASPSPKGTMTVDTDGVPPPEQVEPLRTGDTWAVDVEVDRAVSAGTRFAVHVKAPAGSPYRVTAEATGAKVYDNGAYATVEGDGTTWLVGILN